MRVNPVTSHLCRDLPERAGALYRQHPGGNHFHHLRQGIATSPGVHPYLSRIWAGTAAYPSIVGTFFLVLLSLPLPHRWDWHRHLPHEYTGSPGSLHHPLRRGIACRRAFDHLRAVGFIFFVIKLKMGWSLLAGSLTMAS